MSNVITVNGIGYGERLLVKMILNSHNTSNRVLAMKIKKLRSNFKLRKLNTEMLEITEEEKEKLQSEGWKENDLRNVVLTWESILEKSYHEENGEEVYGKPYKTNILEADWLLQELEKKEHWRVDQEGKPLPIESAMQECIANLICSIDEALHPPEKEEPME